MQSQGLHDDASFVSLQNPTAPTGRSVRLMSGAEGSNIGRETVRIEELLAGFELEPPVTQAALDDLLAHVSATYDAPLPDDYVAFLRTANGADGTFENDAPLVLWASEVLPEANTYEGEQVLPGCLLIGSDAGDGLYGIDMRQDAPAERYVDLYDGPEWELVLWRGSSLRELLIEVSRPAPPDEGFLSSAMKRLRRAGS
jgi:hypothetical protein